MLSTYAAQAALIVIVVVIFVWMIFELLVAPYYDEDDHS